MKPKYKHSLQGQDLSLRDTVEFEPPDGGMHLITALALLLIGGIIGMFFLAAVRSCGKEPEPTQLVCIQCHNWVTKPPMDLTTYKKYTKFHTGHITSSQLEAELQRR